jgi:hypothetical protein
MRSLKGINVAMGGHMNRAIFNALATLLISSTLLPTCGAQERPAEVTGKIRTEPFARYTGNSPLDVSPDGRLLLFFGASTPYKEVKPSGVTEWKPKRGEQYSDMLRVVEWASGRRC